MGGKVQFGVVDGGERARSRTDSRRSGVREARMDLEGVAYLRNVGTLTLPESKPIL